MTSVAFTSATTFLPGSSPSSSALSRVMRATMWLSPTCIDTLAAASPLTTSVMVPGSLLRVLSLIWFLLVDRQQAELYGASSGICGNALPPSGLSLAWARHRRAHRLEHCLHSFLSAQVASPFERAPGVKVERQRERRE